MNKIKISSFLIKLGVSFLEGSKNKAQLIKLLTELVKILEKDKRVIEF